MVYMSLVICALMANTSYALTSSLGGVYRRNNVAFIQCASSRYTPTGQLEIMQRTRSSKTVVFMSNNGNAEDDDQERTKNINNTPPPSSEIDPRRPDKNMPAFLDAMLEIPDPRMLAGDVLFILMINFLLQIGNEVGDPQFWRDGGFAQPITFPTTLLDVVVRDSKMSIAWVLGALWNRSYSSAAVSDDKQAVKVALKVWVDYCSLRIPLELGGSFLFTHSSVDLWLLGREAWYTAIVMSFFRLAYGRYR